MNNYFDEKKARDLVNEFKEFALRDNVIETAIGIIIGASLTQIVSSLVKDLLMPPLGLLLGGIHLNNYKVVLKQAVFNAQGMVIQKSVTLNIGAFAQTIFDFIIITGCLYLAIKAISALNNRYLALDVPQRLSKQEKFLQEIRDLLKEANNQSIGHIETHKIPSHVSAREKQD